MAHELPPLPYPKEALEPHIDALTMEIHHGRHHKAYVDNLNKAIAGNAALEAQSLDVLVANLASVPDNIRGPVRNNGGGHWNHSFFWKILAPKAGGAPTGKLADAINTAFGSFAEFQAKFEAAGLGPEDMDIFEVYAAYPALALGMMDALGFVEPGKSGASARENTARRVALAFA